MAEGNVPVDGYLAQLQEKGKWVPLREDFINRCRTDINLLRKDHSKCPLTSPPAHEYSCSCIPRRTCCQASCGPGEDTGSCIPLPPMESPTKSFNPGRFDSWSSIFIPNECWSCQQEYVDYCQRLWIHWCDYEWWERTFVNLCPKRPFLEWRERKLERDQEHRVLIEKLAVKQNLNYSRSLSSASEGKARKAAAKEVEKAGGNPLMSLDKTRVKRGATYGSHADREAILDAVKGTMRFRKVKESPNSEAEKKKEPQEPKKNPTDGWFVDFEAASRIIDKFYFSNEDDTKFIDLEKMKKELKVLFLTMEKGSVTIGCPNILFEFVKSMTLKAYKTEEMEKWTVKSLSPRGSKSQKDAVWQDGKHRKNLWENADLKDRTLDWLSEFLCHIFIWSLMNILLVLIKNLIRISPKTDSMVVVLEACNRFHRFQYDSMARPTAVAKPKLPKIPKLGTPSAASSSQSAAHDSGYSPSVMNEKAPSMFFNHPFKSC